ncbi:hypothetical protein BJX61DRAFT_534515 [Aspergillus egyptiacus]|nr:hypothetical protein BJX61DRAFT_534515 [Aspergillus egyptiacus]
MRDINFSIPLVNKAAVNITTTLYDRRALDCTSTLPLINSLNHLAYLTASSPRIRDILMVDGGIERLVCILKEGRSSNLMEMWKWSLAFQNVVNIGVRGTEDVRARVVEADVVPVVATILDNYIKVLEKVRAHTKTEHPRHRHHTHHSPNDTRVNGARRSSTVRSSTEQTAPRRQAPPRIEIPPFYHDTRTADPSTTNIASTPRGPLTSPPQRSTFGQDAQIHANQRHGAIPPPATAIPSGETSDGFGLRPVRDAERLPSILPAIFNGLASQPESPTTPHGAGDVQATSRAAMGARHRPILEQHQSASGESDANEEEPTMNGDAVENIVDLQARMELQDSNEQRMIGGVSSADDLTVTDPSEAQDIEAMNFSQRSAVEGSTISNDNAQTHGTLGAGNNANSPALVLNPYSLFLRDRSTTLSQTFLNTLPREEDVLMSLQLLAYVSKYCNLRSYFERTHLVPKLKIDRELQALEEGSSPIEPPEEEDEYVLPDDVNIFPLVEQFTLWYHSSDMQYWACVVMRNLSRKDESKGGIRQCANYRCGKWEETPRSFAKCRRCRRTKYCSKECQQAAWHRHRNWCHGNDRHHDHHNEQPTEQPDDHPIGTSANTSAQ